MRSTLVALTKLSPPVTRHRYRRATWLAGDARHRAGTARADAACILSRSVAATVVLDFPLAALTTGDMEYYMACSGAVL